MALDSRIHDMLSERERRQALGESVSAEELCAGSPELLDELRRLIVRFSSIEQHLGDSTPSSEETRSVTAESGGGSGSTSGAGDTGRFRVLRRHARGGLGEVFLARDEELGRDVALKEIQARHADDPESRARFVLEAQITGGLEHPGIVPVYGLGARTDGRPYYAMRFIEGTSLQEAIDRFHAADVPGRKPGERNLALRQLLRHFLDVCNAINYAHHKGVLHRDIKPHNIMLGKHGETLVVDWGLCKMLAKREGPAATETSPPQLQPTSGSYETLPGSAIGTPVYMSPEQAAGRVDQLGPLSDIYSLGATLYCLLTGRAPMTGKNAAEVLGQVQRGDFEAPRRVKAKVPRGLEAICLKAMALKPEDRYQTVLELSADIEHWLADELVKAYREPMLGRLARWARHHRSAVAGLAVLLLTATVGLSLSAFLISREQARTEAMRVEAEANFEIAHRAVKEMLTEVAQEQLASEPLMEEKRRTLLKKAQTYYQTFLAQKGNRHHLRNETAQAHHHLGDISRLLGQNEEAKSAYKNAIALLDGLVAEHPSEPDYRHRLADSHCYLGEVELSTSHLREAEDAYQAALHLQTTLVDGNPDQPEYRKNLARSHYNLGILYSTKDQPKKAETAYREAIQLLSRLVNDFPKKGEYQQHLARGYLNLGPVLRALGNLDEAEKVYRQGIGLQTALVKEEPRIPAYRYELGVSLNNFGFLLMRTPANAPRHAAALKEFNRARELFEQLVAQFPRVPVYHKEFANTQNNRGDVLTQLGEWQEAEKAWHQALQSFDQLVTQYPDVPDYQGHKGKALGNLGWLWLSRKDQLQDLKKAQHLLEAGLKQVHVALKANPDHRTFREAQCTQHEDMARTLIQSGAHAEAAKHAHKVAAVFPNRGSDHYVAAGLLAQCITAANKDSTLSVGDRRLATRRYGDDAISLLRQGIKRGHRDAKALALPDFEVLANRPDFKQLLSELRADKPKDGP